MTRRAPQLLAASASPAARGLQHDILVVLGSAAGAAALTWLVLVALCRATRLRWTWAPLAALPATATAAFAAPSAAAGAAGALLGALLATAYLIDAGRRDERHGGERRRRTRARRGPIETLTTGRERRRVASGPLGALDLTSKKAPRIALGEDTTSGRPVHLALDQLRKHTLILGATGAGKSNTLAWLTTRAIRAGFGAVVLDMKGDPLLRERLAVEAGLNGRPFYLFRIEPDGQHYNPLRRGDTTARRDRLVASQQFSEDYYRGLFATHAKVVLDVLDGLGREATIAALAELWDPHDLKAQVRRLPSGKRRDALARYLERLPHQQAEHIVSSRARLDEVADTSVAERLCAGLSEADDIDLARAFRRRAVVVFSINADSYPGAGAVLGNLILQDLVGLVGELRQGRETAHAVCAIDEFGALPGEQLGRLLSTARDVDLPVLLAGQDLAQLRRVSEHFEAEVKANVCAVIAHRQSEPDSAEQIARMAGTEEVVSQTQQVDRRRGVVVRRALEPADQTGAGSQHYERQFRVGPDAVKDLEVGEAAVRTAHPARVHVLTVYRCESAAEAAGLAQVRTGGDSARAATVGEAAAIATRARERLGHA